MVGSAHRLYILYDLSAHIYTSVFAPQSYWLWTSLPFTIFITYPLRIPPAAIIRAVEINFVQLNDLLAVLEELVLVFTDVVTFGI